MARKKTVGKEEYYVMRRRMTRKGPADVKVKTCETSLQAWKYINEMPPGKASKHYVKYSPEAIRLYEVREQERRNA